MSSEAHVCILASTRTVCKQLYEPVQLVYAHIIAVFLLLLVCILLQASRSMHTSRVLYYVVCSVHCQHVVVHVHCMLFLGLGLKCVPHTIHSFPDSPPSFVYILTCTHTQIKCQCTHKRKRSGRCMAPRGSAALQTL